MPQVARGCANTLPLNSDALPTERQNALPLSAPQTSLREMAQIRPRSTETLSHRVARDTPEAVWQDTPEAVSLATVVAALSDVPGRSGLTWTLGPRGFDWPSVVAITAGSKLSLVVRRPCFTWGSVAITVVSGLTLAFHFFVVVVALSYIAAAFAMRVITMRFSSSSLASAGGNLLLEPRRNVPENSRVFQAGGGRGGGNRETGACVQN